MVPAPEDAPPKAEASPFWWRGALGAALLALLVVGLHRSQRSPEAARSAAAARLEVETLWAAKAAHLSGWRADVPGIPDGLIPSLRRLAALQPRAVRHRRTLLIVQALSGDPGWRQTADSLHREPALRSLYPGGERALWFDAFGHDALSRAQAARIIEALERMDLGWYRLVVHERVFARAGMPDEARESRRLATRWLRRLAPLAVLMLGALIWGTGLLAVGLYAVVTRRVRPPLGWVLAHTAPGRLDRQRADVLTTVFLVYLLTFLAVKAVGPPIAAAVGAGSSDRVAQVVSVVMMAVVLAVPLLAYKRLCRVYGMGAEHLGVRRGGGMAEVLWGVATYCAALPLVLGATVASAWVFGEKGSPLHPIVNEMPALADPLVLYLLVLQAVVLAPVSEELMFRGAFFGGLASRVGGVGAIIVTSAAFALLHPQLPVGFAGLFILGAAMCGLYAVRGSLVGSMVLHGVNNGAAFLLLWALSAS